MNILATVIAVGKKKKNYNYLYFASGDKHNINSLWNNIATNAPCLYEPPKSKGRPPRGADV